MNTRCTVCNHSQCPTIETQLYQGAPLRDLASTYDLSISALSRHKKHLARKIALARIHQEQEYTASYLGRLNESIRIVENMIQRAMHANQQQWVINGSRELRQLISTSRKIRRQLDKIAAAANPLNGESRRKHRGS